MPGVEREAAEAVENRLAPIHHARAGARNANSIELPERRPNRLLAVVDVVGVTDRAIPGDDEGLSGGERGIKTLALDRVPGGGLIEAGFQITEQHVGVP